VNQVKLSGFLASDPVLHDLGHGMRSAITSLDFSRNCEAIVVVAVEARIRQICAFRKGDAVVVSGRLAINPKTHRAALVVDVAGVWKIANRPGSPFQFDPDKADRSTKEILEVL